MTGKLYVTIAAVIAILYGIAFVLIPSELAPLFGGSSDPHAILNLRFFGSALLAWGAIVWFARDFKDWTAIRGILIGSVIGDIVGAIINVRATLQGLLNPLAWTSTLVYGALLIGALYFLWSGQRANFQQH